MSLSVGDFPLNTLKCMISYKTENQCINISKQKGGVLRFLGCLVHAIVITQLISEIKRRKKDVTVIWLDFANMYSLGSTRGILTNYYNLIFISFKTNDFIAWFQGLQKRTDTGIKSLKVCLKCRQPPCKRFMDYPTVTTPHAKLQNSRTLINRRVDNTAIQGYSEPTPSMVANQSLLSLQEI